MQERIVRRVAYTQVIYLTCLFFLYFVHLKSVYKNVIDSNSNFIATKKNKKHQFCYRNV